MNKFVIMGIKIGKRSEDASDVQGLLTEYGCIIKTRLGLHEATTPCSQSGLIILELTSECIEEINALEEKLNSIESVSAKRIEI